VPPVFLQHFLLNALQRFVKHSTPLHFSLKEKHPQPLAAQPFHKTPKQKWQHRWHTECHKNWQEIGNIRADDMRMKTC